VVVEDPGNEALAELLLIDSEVPCFPFLAFSFSAFLTLFLLLELLGLQILRPGPVIRAGADAGLGGHHAYSHWDGGLVLSTVLPNDPVEIQRPVGESGCQLLWRDLSW